MPPEINIPFDPIITLLVFLIGVPAFVLQSMPPDVRRILFERSRLIRFLFWLIVVPVLSAFVVSGVGVYAELTVEPDSREQAFRWTVILSIMIAVIFVVAVYFPIRYSRRQGVLRVLEREALHFLKSEGRLPEEVVEDILDMGKNAESIQEKNTALQVIHSLVLNTCHHISYNGDRLETLILRLHEVLMVDSKSATLENFRMVAEIFQEIAIARREIPHVADLQRTVKATGSLGRAALLQLELGQEADNILMNLIQTLGLINYVKPLDTVNGHHTTVISDVSEALFDIGSLAAENRRHFISVAALDKLIAMICYTPLTNDIPDYVLDELAADVVGLMAHIWSDEKGQQEYVRKRMPEVRSCLGMSDSINLKKARAHYLSKSQFDTVNCIDQMFKGLKPRPHRKKK